jgi:hypothetical protein
MYTVFLQGADRGVGMGYEHFVAEFERICDIHIRNGRARAFAFIFYDLSHGPILDALQSERGFEILNSLTGKDITLFYLHSEAVPSYSEAFNKKFLKALNIDKQISPPCIVFFRVNEQNIEDVDFRNIDSKTQEPFLVIEELRRHTAGYLDLMNEQGDLSGLTWIAKSGLLGLLRQFLRMGH